MLTREGILDAAQVLVDTYGLDGLCLTDVARMVGAKKPSLYRHVHGMDDIETSLASRWDTTFVDVVTGAQSLAELAHAWRRFAKEHPGLLEASARTHGPLEYAASATAYDASRALETSLLDLGIAPERTQDVARGLDALVRGFVQSEWRDPHHAASWTASFETAVDAFVLGLERL